MFTATQARFIIISCVAFIMMTVIGASVSTDWKYRAVSVGIMLILSFVAAFAAANTDEKGEDK